jgi:hypothetical protein
MWGGYGELRLSRKDAMSREGPRTPASPFHRHSDELSRPGDER